MLFCKNDETVVPKIIYNYVVNWYHTYLLHPGKVHTEATISQHYYLHQLRDDICIYIKVFNTCQKNKKHNLKYGKLLSKEAEAIPWDRLLVDIISHIKLE